MLGEGKLLLLERGAASPNPTWWTINMLSLEFDEPL